MIDLRRYSFGAHVGVLTSLGLLVGLEDISGARSAIIESLLITGIAGNLESALGIYVYHTSERMDDPHALANALGNFGAWLSISLSFIIIVLSAPRLGSAVVYAILWGLGLLAFLGWAGAKAHKTDPLIEIAKHVGMGIAGLAVSEAIGDIVPVVIP